jgi:peroxiredoxin
MPKRSSPADALRAAFEAANRLDAPLSSKLASYAEASRPLIPDTFAAYDNFISHLVSSGAGENAPRAGDEVPDFLLPDGDGHLVALSKLLEAGPAVISFNRGHWCPYCRLELRALAQAYGAIKEAGATVISIVPEPAEFTGAMTKASTLPFQVLSDIDHGYALSLGLVVWTGFELKSIYADSGINLPKFQGNESWFLPIPATLVVGIDGRVKASMANPNFFHRLPMENVLGALRS